MVERPSIFSSTRLTYFSGRSNAIVCDHPVKHARSSSAHAYTVSKFSHFTLAFLSRSLSAISLSGPRRCTKEEGSQDGRVGGAPKARRRPGSETQGSKNAEAATAVEDTQSLSPDTGSSAGSGGTGGTSTASEPNSKRQAVESKRTLESAAPQAETTGFSPPVATTGEPSPPTVQLEVLLNTYFTRFHGKPYHILDEPLTRQRHKTNQLPNYLTHAIYAVSARSVIGPLSSSL